jgi:hypothetical protein
MAKALEIPDNCPVCGGTVEVDDFGSWMVVRCKSNTCDWWDQGKASEDE